jgi:hypothetical protein
MPDRPCVNGHVGKWRALMSRGRQIAVCAECRKVAYHTHRENIGAVAEADVSSVPVLPSGPWGLDDVLAVHEAHLGDTKAQCALLGVKPDVLRVLKSELWAMGA